MTRDELLLASLAAGETTTAELVRTTGVGERSCRYGLQRLIRMGYVWSPVRGRWRLTEGGWTIASELVGLPKAGGPDVEPIPLPTGGTEPAASEGSVRRSLPTEDPTGMPPLGWALAGIGVAVALAIARRLTSPPSPPSPASPTGAPHDGWVHLQP